MLYNVILSVRSGNGRMCSGMCDLSRFLLSGLGPLVSLISKIFKLCGFQMFMLLSVPDEGYYRNALYTC